MDSGQDYADLQHSDKFEVKAKGNVTVTFLRAGLSQKEKVFVQRSLGFRQMGKVLGLKRTLYGMCQSPRKFWKHLTQTMADCDMVASGFDPCMFVGGCVVAFAFVGNILFWATDDVYINHP